MIPLARQVTSIRLKEPLPFGVFDADGNLLLARGRVLHTEEQLRRLIERGACVNAEDVAGLERKRKLETVSEPQTTGATFLRLEAQLKKLLLEPTAHPAFQDELVTIGLELSDLVVRNPDRAMFQLLHARPSDHSLHSVWHAVKCAVASHLVAERLHWNLAQRHSLVSAALTMNLAMTRLHSTLAMQPTPPTDEQRMAIRKHPQEGVELLSRLGVQDPDWLRAVAEHHETPDSKGYPQGLPATFEPAEILRHVDILMAKSSGRVDRKAIFPNQAMRDIFVENGRNQIAAAVIKVFGIYPPGTFVRLASGVLAVVVVRGESADKPTVAVLVNKNGEALSEPIRRDCSNPTYAIVSIVEFDSVKVHVDPEKLYV
jgi:HD-GYP domain-containing protein (c-di-GMP phosphodiesterase class II)